MSDCLVRPARLEDLPVVEGLWTRYDDYHRSLGLAFPQVEQAAAAWRSSFERTLGRFSFLWVAELEGQVCGFLLARLKRTPAYLGGVLVGEISDLYVSEEARQEKIGSRLAGEAIRDLRTHQVHSIEVQVLERNHGARAFWQAQGFEAELTQFRLQTQQD